MPIPQDLVRVHLNWTTGPEEIAVSTFMVRLKHESGAPTNWAEMTQDLASKTYDAWNSAFAGSTGHGLFTPGVVLRDVSTYHLDAATGHTLDKGTATRTGNALFGGTAGAGSLPLECAVAVSLYGYQPGSFVPDRARKRGRMYLPPMAVNIMDQGDPQRAGRLGAGPWSDIHTCVSNFFNDMQGKSVGQDPLGIGQYWDLVVVSRAGNFATPVLAVRTGDVVDVQRRRRNAQKEVYKTTAITPGG